MNPIIIEHRSGGALATVLLIVVVVVMTIVAAALLRHLLAGDADEPGEPDETPAATETAAP